MGKKRKELSHEEIWDDGGLVQSWNESYEEYKVTSFTFPAETNIY